MFISAKEFIQVDGGIYNTQQASDPADTTIFIILVSIHLNKSCLSDCNEHLQLTTAYVVDSLQSDPRKIDNGVSQGSALC